MAAKMAMSPGQVNMAKLHSIRYLWAAFTFAAAFVASLACATVAIAAAKPLAGALRQDEALWLAYTAQFVMGDGRVIDNVNGSISHTESQGYGMLLAVAANDKATFERIWAFTEKTMYVRDDGLGAWKFEPNAGTASSASGGKITDMNNATDGDILIAWALAEAGAAGFGKQFSARAIELSRALSATVYKAGQFGLQIMPGKLGFSAEERGGKPVVNLSYWVFPAFDRLAVLTPQPMWQDLMKSGKAHIEASQTFAAALPSDWLALDFAAGTIASAPGFDDAFGYNGIRIPLYLAMTGPKSRRMLRASFEQWFQLEGPLKTVGANDRALRDTLSDPGYEAIRALYNCATAATPFPASTLTSLDINYYPATLQMLAIIAARQSYPRCI
jgi:endoglucanase